jgi:hypothetical protein
MPLQISFKALLMMSSSWRESSTVMTDILRKQLGAANFGQSEQTGIPEIDRDGERVQPPQMLMVISWKSSWGPFGGSLCGY